MPVLSRITAIVILAAGVIFAGCCSCTTAGTGGYHDGRSEFPAAVAAPRILSTVPDVRQSTPYSCGAASLQAVLNYWGKDLSENELLVLLNTSEESGTPPENIVDISRSLGFPAELRTDVTLQEIEAAVNAGMPVIVGTQAWQGNVTPPFRVVNRNSGHYLVIIGIDDTNIYIEDPSVLGSRGIIPREEFLTQWRDCSGWDIRKPAPISMRRVAIFIRGDIPTTYPECIEQD